MKNKYKKYWLILASMIMITITVMWKESVMTVYASSATVGFEIEDKPYMVGDTIQVKLTIQADADIGDFEGNILYDSAILSYQDGPECISGGDGMLRIEDIGESDSSQQRVYIMNFSAVNYGDCLFSFVEPPIAYEAENGNAMSVSATTNQVTVDAQISASNNTDLVSLKINPSQLTPTFRPDVTEYDVIVDNTTKNLVISAIAKDPKSIVQLYGNENLAVGNNEVIITVIAESGVKKEYRLHVQKEEKVTVEPTKEPEKEEISFHGTVENGITVLKGSYKYQVATDDTIEIPKEYTKTSIKIDGFDIPVYQLQGQSDYEFLLLVLTNQYGQTGVYRYDRKEHTIQRYTPESITIQNLTDDDTAVMKQMQKDYEHTIGIKNFVIIVLCITVVLLVAGIFTIYFKLKSNNEEDDFL